jgi:hypothetical protein
MIVAPPSPLSDPSINKVDVMTPFLIGQLCAAKNGTLAATANFAIEFEVIFDVFDVRRVGVVEDMRAKYLIVHFEFSRSRYPLIIRFESGARRKISRRSVA